MAKKILVNIDMGQNEIQNVLVHKLSSAPGSPLSGQIYYNTTTNKIMMYNGSAWVDLTSQGTGTVTSVGITAGSGISSTGGPITGSGNITVGHSNSVTAKTTQALYPIKYDAQGHITGSGSAVVPVLTSDKGVAGGVATLGTDGLVPSAQLPSYVDDVIEVSTYSDLSATGETGKIYITLDTNKTYRWSGTTYVEISQSEIHKYTTTIIGDASTTSYSITHGLGDLGVLVNVYDTTTNAEVMVDIVVTNSNTVTINFAKAFASTQSYKVVVVA
jgi:hypothetical protein